jgi:hypothetical protein
MGNLRARLSRLEKLPATPAPGYDWWCFVAFIERRPLPPDAAAYWAAELAEAHAAAVRDYPPDGPDVVEQRIEELLRLPCGLIELRLHLPDEEIDDARTRTVPDGPAAR